MGYSLDIGKEHVNLIDQRLEKLIYSGQLDAKELDRYLPNLDSPTRFYWLCFQTVLDFLLNFIGCVLTVLMDSYFDVLKYIKKNFNILISVHYLHFFTLM